MNFWEKLPKPFFAMAPLANVTDAAFRRMFAKYSKPFGPDVMFTEFTSADGLFSEGRDALMNDLMFTEGERPIVAQFFTAKPELMEKAAALAVELGFDGVDINMGCPDKGIEKQGAGAALIKNPKLAKELIQAAKRGAPHLPISVKTRLGWSKVELEEWLPVLLEEDLAAVTIHARTRKELSLVPARWEFIKRAVEIRDTIKKETLIIGNGDVASLGDARAKAQKTGADGVMLGRAMFGKPWLFSSSEEHWNKEDPKVLKEVLDIMVEHTKLFEELLGDVPGRSGKSFSIMKKHYKAYVNGFDGAKELRIKLMEAKNSNEVEKIVQKWKNEEGLHASAYRQDPN